MKFTSENIKKEVFDVKQIYSEEFNQLGGFWLSGFYTVLYKFLFPDYWLYHCLGVKLKGLVDAAQNYHAVLAENRRLHNEVQDLKGTIA